MNKIENKFKYPHYDTPVLAHYSEYDSVFVGLLPFVKLDKEDCDNKSSKKVISMEEARAKDPLFKKIENRSNVTIYSSNECYPTDQEIAHMGKRVSWDEVIQDTALSTKSELNTALQTTIGALKKQYERGDLAMLLNEYTEKRNIWHPIEGTFNFFTKCSIFDLLKKSGIEEVVIDAEFNLNRKLVSLINSTQEDFCERIDYNDYYIYDRDESILFAIDWDSFFFFIAIDNKVVPKSSIESYFDGFWANEKFNHYWGREYGMQDEGGLVDDNKID